MRIYKKHLALLCVASGLGGCGVYMHDAALKTSTAEAKASFDAIAAPAFLTEQRQHLIVAGKEEDAAVSGYATALRNETILTLLRPGGTVAPGSSAKQRLRGLVDRDLEQTYGSAPASRDALYRIETARDAIELNRQNVINSAAEVDSARRDFVQLAPRDDKRPTACAKVPPPPPRAVGAPPQLPPGASEADRAYAWLQAQCAEWRFQSDLVVLAGAGGQIGALRGQIQAAKAARDADAEKAEALRKEIKEAAKAPGEAPAAIPTAADLAARGEAIADKLERAPALARKAGLEEIAKTLEERVVDELRGTSADLAEDERAVAALGFVRASRDAAESFRSRPSMDKAAALLIGLAAVRHKLNMAEADIALQQGQMDNLQRQLSAAIARASHLARAKSILQRKTFPNISGFAEVRDIKDGSERSAASEALTAYVAAWNEGEIPYQVLRFRAVQARRLAAIDRAQLAEQDYRAVVKPAVDTLAEYGAGGVTPEAIVTLLGHLGISGSILAR